MRFKTCMFTLLFLVYSLSQAQVKDYPTLDALANVDIPAFDWAELWSRLTQFEFNYVPPETPTQYDIGDIESFRVRANDGTQITLSAELRGKTDKVLIWVIESVNYSRSKAQAMAERLEQDVVIPLQQLFNYAEPPGIDGDPRLFVVMVHNQDDSAAGSFLRKDTLPRELFSISNQREMIVRNLALEDGSYDSDARTADVIAHEFQHVLLHHRDPSEETWLDEALSGFSEHFTGGFDGIYWQGGAFLEAPNTSLTQFVTGENRAAKYGAGELFSVFLAEQFGNEVIGRLQAENADGWRSVDKVLRQHYGASADEVFADWVLANYFLDADRGFGYRTIQKLPEAPQPSVTIRTIPAVHSGKLPQYSSEYLAVDVRGADALKLRLTQASEGQLIEASPVQGDYFYYAVTTESSTSRLTRSFDSRTFRRAWLEFSIWYDLKENIEYAFVEISSDDGETWTILPGLHTVPDEPKPRFFYDGYTGSSGGWRRERMDLSNYASRDFLLRFEVVSADLTTYKGVAIDDLRIDAIGYHEGFEADDNAWVAEGWIRTDNRLPQNTWLQVVQETADGLHLNRSLISGTGDLSVDLMPGAKQVLVAISPVVPQTALDTEYELEFNLIDGAGEIMVISRDCTVTTTHGLNFRDAPNGSKIGLLPQGTSVDALDRRGDWFQVEYDGVQGWISAGYVTTQGNCA